MTMINNEVNPTDLQTPNNDEELYIWLDILGFSDEVESITDLNQKEKIKTVLDGFKAIFIDSLKNNQMQELETFKKNLGFKQPTSLCIDEGRMISDGIMLNLGSITDEQNRQSLEDFFLEIGIRQMFFVLKYKRLIRGGIALGKNILKETPLNNQEKSHQVQHYVSSGLVRAYKIETKHVSWPIIATTFDQIKKIQNTPKIGEELFGLRKTFNKDGKDIYFIDFLRNLDPQSQYIEFLHKRLSEELDKKDHAVCAKIIWLIRHYKQHHELGEDHAHLKGAFL